MLLFNDLKESSFTTDILNTTTSYFVTSSEEISSANVGPPQHEGQSNYSSGIDAIGFISFDALDNFTLESVNVYTEEPAERKFILINEAGEVIEEHTEFIGFCADEPQLVELNFYIPAGINYQIGTDSEVNITNVGGENPQLKRTGPNSGLSYPYVLDGKVSINKAVYYGQGVDNSGGDDYTSYYYYLYNWNIKEICSSPFAEVEAKIGSNEDLTISVNDCPYDSIILSAQGNFTSYEWNNQSTQSNLTIYEIGEYTVNVYDSIGCTASETINISSIPSFEINTNEILCTGSSIYLQCPSDLNSYYWNTGESTNAISISNSGIYTVNALDSDGCELSDEIEVYSFDWLP